MYFFRDILGSNPDPDLRNCIRIFCILLISDFSLFKCVKQLLQKFFNFVILLPIFYDGNNLIAETKVDVNFCFILVLILCECELSRGSVPRKYVVGTINFTYLVSVDYDRDLLQDHAGDLGCPLRQGDHFM